MPSRKALIGSLIAVAMLAPLGTSTNADGERRRITKQIPQYEKVGAECRNNRCIRGYHKRKRCDQKSDGSIDQNKCYIRYAAWFYHQDPHEAMATARCESGLDERAVSPGGTYEGNWQFDKATWEDAPHSRAIVRKNDGSVAVKQSGRVRRRDVPRFSAKYTALGAMWYWKKGERWRWPVCG